MAKVSMFVKFTAQPGRRDDVLAALAAVVPLVEDEEGTEVYSFHSDQLDADVVWLVEVYRDGEALDAHAKGAAVKQLFAALGDVLATPADLHFTAPAGGKGLA